MNPKIEATIAAAKERTRLLMEAANGKQAATQTLPAAFEISQIEKAVEERIKEQQSTTILIQGDGTKFDPYEIPGVGRANERQSAAIKLFGLEGKSGCLIGPAGTGKTTTMRAMIKAMVHSGRIPILPDTFEHKYLSGGKPGIFGGSFTRIATRNLRDNIPGEIKDNIHTIHRLLEFEPEVFTTTDPATGKEKTVRLFKPTRHSFRTLPKELVVFITDEASMVGTRLAAQQMDAIHPSITPQMIYIGDIAQIPPVMDDAILGFKMLDSIKDGTMVELTEVYRHAGAIVELANHIRVGNTIPPQKKILNYLGNLRRLPRKLVEDEIVHWNKEEDGSKVSIHLWKSRLEGETGQFRAMQNLGIFAPPTKEFPNGQRGFFVREIEAGNYDPMKHMILMPYNKAVGTIELNKYIAHYLQRKRVSDFLRENPEKEVPNDLQVYEVIAGRSKMYLSVGDKVFHEREEAVITKININANYMGKGTKPASVTLDRWGHDTAGMAEQISGDDKNLELDSLLDIDIGGEDEERKNQASHVIYIKKLIDLDKPGLEADSINTAAEVNGIIFGYALTIHKSQGSQWPKVYCVFHNSHNRNLQRELLYTAITRAQKELYVIAEPETFIQGVISQHIIGNTLEQKAEYFKGKVVENAKRDDLFNGAK